MVLGGLYLYMNRYDHVRLSGLVIRGVTYLRINTLTGYECLVHQGHAKDIRHLSRRRVNTTPLCDDDKEAKRQSSCAS